MKCPNDDTTLVMTDRNGVEIDYCPNCRGVWLDRGELDKIIERSSQPEQQSQTRQSPDQGYPRSGDRNYQKPRKKDSFLGDLFDF